MRGRELPSCSDETMKKIAHELTESLKQNLPVDWSVRASVQAKLRLMVKRIGIDSQHRISVHHRWSTATLLATTARTGIVTSDLGMLTLITGSDGTLSHCPAIWLPEPVYPSSTSRYLFGQRFTLSWGYG